MTLASYKKMKGGRQVVASPDEPLSVSELRELNGEPVWCSGFGWRICYGLTTFRGHLCMETGAGSCISMQGYGESWIAYRRKPNPAAIDTILHKNWRGK